MSVWNEGQVHKAEMMIVPMGFLQENYELLCQRYPRMNKDYLLSIVEVLLSSACWNVYTIDKYGSLSPNIWIQIISPSGDGKTLPIDYFIIPILKELEKILSTESERYILHISDYTKEALIKYFKEKKPKKGKKKTRQLILKFGMLCKDENTMYLEAANNKSFMKDIIAVESKLYDGKLYRKVTVKRGVEEVPRCFKSNISATTPAIYVYMKVDAFIQGGWNRYDFIIGCPIRPKDVKLLDKTFFFGGGNTEDRQKFERISFDCAEELKKVIDGEKIYVMLDDKASLLWRQFEQEMKQKAVALPNKDLTRGYLQRQAEKALKRGMLYTISRHLKVLDKWEPMSFPDFNGDKKNERLMICEEDEMKIAIENQRKYLEYWKQMMVERLSEAEPGNVSTDEVEIAFFDNKCKLLGNQFEIFSRAQISNATKWKDGNPKFTTNIDNAIEQNKLVRYTADESRAICMMHRQDEKWFEDRSISLSFKNPPHLFKWIGDD